MGGVYSLHLYVFAPHGCEPRTIPFIEDLESKSSTEIDSKI